MHRIDQWEAALAVYFRLRADMLFDWGTVDCCLYAADGVEIMRGVDMIPEFRGRYTTALGAKRLLNKHGGTPSAVADDRLGARVGGLMLRRGDVAAMDDTGAEVLGIVTLDGQGINAPGYSGTVTRPLSDALHGWHV